MGASYLKERVQRPWDRGGAWVKDGFVREANRNWDSYSSMGKGTVAGGNLKCGLAVILDRLPRKGSF